MSKEELFDQGWELTYSGPTGVKAWNEWMVHLRHPSGRRASGYGIDEQSAINDVASTIQKPLETKNEISH